MPHDTSTALLQPDQDGILQAVDILRNDGLVAFPTETVYGLGADACSAAAVRKVFAVKSRPRQNPLIVHVRDFDVAAEFVIRTTWVDQIVERWWPGPLTIIARRSDSCRLVPEVSGGMDTVALRSPAEPVAQHLLAEFGGPLVGPSANLSGHVSPTTAAHVLTDLNGKIDAVIDGGQCRLGIESTIIDCTGEVAVLRRKGVIQAKDLSACLTSPVQTSLRDTEQSPGSFPSHYAPQACIRLNATAAQSDEAWLGFGPDPVGTPPNAMNLSPAANLDEAAQNLYVCMRQLDMQLGGTGTIAVAPVPEIGIGVAINDRLRRAAAPRAV